jgi:hypothetical protein
VKRFDVPSPTAAPRPSAIAVAKLEPIATHRTANTTYAARVGRFMRPLAARPRRTFDRHDSRDGPSQRRRPRSRACRGLTDHTADVESGFGSESIARVDTRGTREVHQVDHERVRRTPPSHRTFLMQGFYGPERPGAWTRFRAWISALRDPALGVFRPRSGFTPVGVCPKLFPISTRLLSQ